MPRFPDCKKIFPFRFALLSPPPPNSARCEEERGKGRKRDSGIAGEDYFFFLRPPFLLRRRRFSENGVMGGTSVFSCCQLPPLPPLPTPTESEKEGRRSEGFFAQKGGEGGGRTTCQAVKRKTRTGGGKGTPEKWKMCIPVTLPLPFSQALSLRHL